MVAGATLLGHLRGLRMSPVYALNVDVRPGAKPGMLTINYFCTPLLMLSSLQSVDLTGSPILIPCEQLSREERKRLRNAVTHADEAIRQLRAADAGVMLAKTMPEGR